MTSQIPSSLKRSDLSRFATRAAQLEKFKPSVSYWCYYHIVNKILANGWHTTDEECKTYTTLLMDKLESMKLEHPSDAAIHDDQAARSNMAQFALATFERAEKARTSYAATRQTADTYLAASTFLELLKTWDTANDPEEDISGKIKAAKFHALRIANALKNGQDPNERPLEPEPPALDEDDPEVQAINAAAAADPPGPSVEEIPDEELYNSHHGQPVPFSRTLQDGYDSMPPPQADTLFPEEHQRRSFQPSPVSQPNSSRKSSLGEGYFPEVEQPTHQNTPPIPPQMSPASSRPPPAQSAFDESQYHQAPPRATAPLQPPPHTMPFRSPSSQHSLPRTQTSLPPHQYYQQQPTVPSTPEQSSIPSTNRSYRTDDASIAAAQKHAKWAVSALNFDDPATAVKEFRLALESLGAR